MTGGFKRPVRPIDFTVLRRDDEDLPAVRCRKSSDGIFM